VCGDLVAVAAAAAAGAPGVVASAVYVALTFLAIDADAYPPAGVP